MGEYNGWRNYETWAVSLYLDGNHDGEGTYRHVLSLAEDVYGDERDPAEGAQRELADILEEYVKDQMDPAVWEGASLAGDLLGAALGDVDWWRLAGAKLEEIAEREEVQSRD
jgi:hypothetical protein